MKINSSTQNLCRCLIITLLLPASLLLSSCSTTKPRQELKTAAPLTHPIKGRASWYGPGFHKRRTASGERFNMYDLTAAHRTLPLGSKIRIRNLHSGQTVVVRINDRGPRSKSRLIDVSYSAGKALGMISKGIIPVEIETL